MLPAPPISVCVTLDSRAVPAILVA